jgi:hypothetical protein
MVRVILGLILAISTINAVVCVDSSLGSHRLFPFTLHRSLFPFVASQSSSSDRILLASETASSASNQDFAKSDATKTSVSRNHIASVINVERGLFRCLQAAVHVNLERNQFLTPIRSTVLMTPATISAPPPMKLLILGSSFDQTIIVELGVASTCLTLIAWLPAPVDPPACGLARLRVAHGSLHRLSLDGPNLHRGRRTSRGR